MEKNIYKKKRKNDYLFEWLTAVGLAIMTYFFTVVNGSNLGNRLNTSRIWLAILLIAVLYQLLIKKPLPYPNSSKYMFQTFWLLVLVFIISSMKNFPSAFGILLGIMIITVFSFSYIGEKKNALIFIGYFYAVMTLYILYDFTHGGFTQNWNTNSMGLLSSYGVYWMFITRTVNGKKRVFFDWTIIYMLIVFIAVTDSRTTLIGITIYILFRFFIFKSLFYKKWFYRVYYIVVFLLPIGIVNLYLSLWKNPFSAELDRISYQYTNKLFFSGREVIWDDLYKNMSGHWILGYGNQLIGNAHSLYMNILYCVGIIGLVFFLLFLISIYEYLFDYCKDEIVRGCILTFSSTYLMQTFETVMFNTDTLNILPYLILSAAIGRSLVLHQQKTGGQIYGC